MKKRWRGVMRYHSPREMTLGNQARHVRKVSYGLKTAERWAVIEAAIIMSERIAPDSVLVPIPRSNGDRGPNRVLAELLSEFVPGSRVLNLVKRATPLQSSLERRHQGVPGWPALVQAASMKKTRPIPRGVPVVLIDNILVTGATMEGAWIAMGRPKNVTGLAYAYGREVLT